MSELFAIFDDGDEPRQAIPQMVMMSDRQRAEIRDLFGQLEIRTAVQQFAVIEELTGTRISSVNELQGAQAHRAIEGLRRRVESSSTVRTGNSWDDRDEPTWIDRL